jgi:hypothetical protein
MEGMANEGWNYLLGVAMPLAKRRALMDGAGFSVHRQEPHPARARRGCPGRRDLEWLY